MNVVPSKGVIEEVALELGIKINKVFDPLPTPSLNR